MAIEVRKRIRQPIDRSWKNTSLEWADPTAADRTRPRPTVSIPPKPKKVSRPPTKPGRKKVSRPPGITGKPQFKLRPKVKVKPIQESEIIEAEGGGKVKYRSIGGKVTNGNDITRMVYD